MDRKQIDRSLAAIRQRWGNVSKSTVRRLIVLDDCDLIRGDMQTLLALFEDFDHEREQWERATRLQAQVQIASVGALTQRTDELHQAEQHAAALREVLERINKSAKEAIDSPGIEMHKEWLVEVTDTALADQRRGG